MKSTAHRFFLLFVTASLLCSTSSETETQKAATEIEWYISNSSGMALERTIQTRAMREKYALQVRYIEPNDTPREIRKYYSAPWRIERRILYENGKRSRTQWSFWDEIDTAYFVAVIGNDGAGFIEWYDETGRIVEEQRLDPDGSGYFISYTYKDSFLIKSRATAIEPYKKNDASAKNPNSDEKTAKTQEDAAKPAADTENAMPETKPPANPAPDTIQQAPSPATAADDSDAGVDADDETLVHEMGITTPAPAVVPPPSPQTVIRPLPPPQSASKLVRYPEQPAVFPAEFIARSGREGAVLWTDTYRYARAKSIRSVERHVMAAGNGKAEFVKMQIPRTIEIEPDNRKFVEPATSFISSFLADILYDKTARITYTTDNKRRIVSQMYYNEKDEPIGEMRNQWDNDRLLEVLWKNGEDERRIEYQYNKHGDRTSEKDYNKGILERTVQIDGSNEIERVYREGHLILEAIWQDGRKISERRIPPPRAGVPVVRELLPPPRR
ncbi:MAG: hypothetical protein LBG74_03940 [Spirochaetaceae bacterium]|jgi:hypothetical protein|nr:hypothetical protein [Spirochaetaceae bacterium]